MIRLNLYSHSPSTSTPKIDSNPNVEDSLRQQTHLTYGPIRSLRHEQFQPSE